MLSELEFSQAQVKFAVGLIKGDVLGDLIKGRIKVPEAIDKIEEMARNAGMELHDFFNILTIYYSVDASSYPALFKRLFKQQNQTLHIRSNVFILLKKEITQTKQEEKPDEKYSADDSDNSFQIQTIAQQDFLNIVNWLKEKGY